MLSLSIECPHCYQKMSTTAVACSGKLSNDRFVAVFICICGRPITCEILLENGTVNGAPLEKVFDPGSGISITEGSEFVLAIHPANPFPKVSERLRPEIKHKLFEALVCLRSEAYNASFAMCRSALETACILKGAKGNLKEMIDQLEKSGDLSALVARMSHIVRFLGNESVHENISPEEAKLDAVQMYDFTTAVIDYLYIVPLRVSIAESRTVNRITD